MTPELSMTDVYTDFQGLGRLRAKARQDSPGALREVASQFEGLMLQMMLKGMRQASLGEGLLDNDQTRFYRDLYDQQLALHLGAQDSLGLADLLVQQLGGDKVATPAVQPDPVVSFYHGYPKRDSPTAPLHNTLLVNTAEAARPLRPEPFERVPAVESGSASNTELQVALPESPSPEVFIERLGPLAQQVAARIGVAPEVLLAQAALETGWGRKVIHQPDGSSSYNLFGIKADHRWGGDTVKVTTVEYEDGIAVRQQAAFRAYGSYRESFEDYVNFLKVNPRYREALTKASDPPSFAAALQKAGYATDPAYGDKIVSILARDPLRKGLEPLKVAESEPLSLSRDTAK